MFSDTYPIKLAHDCLWEVTGKVNKFKTWGPNENGILSKQESLRGFLDTENPSVIFIQETKCTRIGQIQIDGYQIFDTVRNQSEGGGGGILLGISNEGFPNPILVCQGDDNVELLVVQIEIGPIPVRLFCAYGPQEGSQDCLAFYQRLEEEVENAIDAGCGIIMELDATQN